MEPLISVGPINIYLFGFMIAIGAGIGLYLFLKAAKNRGFDEKILVDGILYAFIGGVVGARLIYAFVYKPQFYLSNPLELFFIHNGGLSIHGGLLGGFLVAILFLQRKKIPILKTLDIAAPFIILAQGISRIGCDVFGVPIASDPLWAIKYDGELVHPVQAYEFILNYLLFGYLWLRLKSKAYDGQVFFHYVIGFLAIRGFVEFFRENPLLFGAVSVSHVMSLIGIVIAILVINNHKKRTILIIAKSVERYEIAKVGFYTLGLTLVSIILYYLLQG